MVCVICDGNIGSGKSTLIQYLESAKFAKEHVVVLEPVDEWTKATGNEESLFEKYYKDKKRYGFLFQMYALETRISKMYTAIKENPDKIVICERSHFTDCFVFAKMLLQEGFIDTQEYNVYESWFRLSCGLFKNMIKGIIYLQAEPRTCLNRIFKRMRKGEESISYSYIDTLHKLHEEWLLNTEIPVCIVDANVDEKELEYSKMINFVNTLI